MCRFFIIISNYITPKLLKNLLLFDEYSLFKQCYRSGCYELREMTYKVNMDGFGIGWFNKNDPLAYRNITQPWNDLNLLQIINTIKTTHFIGHIRAMPPIRYDCEQIKENRGVNPVHQYNCHPFIYHEWMFCHNGNINGFNNGVIRRNIINNISDTYLAKILGTTDSEYLFFLILSYHEKHNIIKSILQTIKFIASVHGEHNLNFVLTNKKDTIIARYNNTDKVPPSLYMKQTNHSFMCASEPLNNYDKWELIKKNTLVHIKNNKIYKIINI